TPLFEGRLLEAILKVERIGGWDRRYGPAKPPEGRDRATENGGCGARDVSRTRVPGRLGSPSAPTTRGRLSMGWTWQGERGEIPALGAPKKSARVAEATVLR